MLILLDFEGGSKLAIVGFPKSRRADFVMSPESHDEILSSGTARVGWTVMSVGQEQVGSKVDAWAKAKGPVHVAG